MQGSKFQESESVPFHWKKKQGKRGMANAGKKRREKRGMLNEGYQEGLGWFPSIVSDNVFF